MLIGYTQSDTYTDWAGAQYTNVYSREMTRDGDRILTEKVTSIDGALLTNDVKNVKYMYDAKGASGMIVDGTKYYFRKNIFGDVVEIYNESGAKCAEYGYDAWGTCYTHAGHERSRLSQSFQVQRLLLCFPYRAVLPYNPFLRLHHRSLHKRRRAEHLF